MTETKRLGRGLEALLGPISQGRGDRQRRVARDRGRARSVPIPISRDASSTRPSSRSWPIRSRRPGLLQPVVVRARPDGRYELIAGERRWRAVQRLGWQKIPAVVKDVDDRALLTLALIENLQRDDLSPLDAALGYQRLMQEFSLPQQEVARLVGKDRSTVSNTLRLLRLPAEVQQLLQQRQALRGSCPGAARAHRPPGDHPARPGMRRRGLVGARSRSAGARGAGSSGAPAARKTIRRPKPEVRNPSADVRLVEDALRKRLQTDVRVTARRRGRGAVTIHYYSNDDLARVLELILGAPFTG